MLVFQRYFHKHIIAEVDLPNQIPVIVSFKRYINLSSIFPCRSEILGLLNRLKADSSTFISFRLFSATVVQNPVFFNLFNLTFNFLLNLLNRFYLSLI